MDDKITTIVDLAVMVKRGFDGVDKRFDSVLQIQKDMLEELNATHEDVRYLKNTVGALGQSDIAHEAAIEELKTRVHRLEQKAGLAR